MLVDPVLSEWSDHLFQATLVVLLLALVFTTLEYAAARVAKATSKEPATVGGAGEGDTAVAVAEAPDDAGEAPGRPRSDRYGRIGVSLMVLAALTHIGSIVLRGFAAYRWPLGNMYEFTSALCFMAVVAWLVLLRRHPALRPAGVFVLTPVVLLMFVTGTVLYLEAAPVLPALQSYWIIIHVTTITLASGLLLIPGVSSLLFLMKRSGKPSGLAGKLPSAEALDRLAYRVTVLAFPLYTFGIITGAVWAEAAWNRFWGWDPKETVAFVAWVLYAAYLHARATSGWRSSRAAWINVLGFATIVFNLFFINMVVSGLHSYAGF
ncbi:Cytochrome c-type biogenesis protein CcsA/ResC [Pseudonocardia sp. Ae168_Ps1]|uniref:c-type cytochrome biogenesis protein CcsB n=1 Tax=unclassified Pseudonocardia TaxID=2619320 RepID=UPI00094B25DB|nr:MULTISPECIES: c-type cytochrome biogenesis protein CcsB [unclassified Pseudonocardia]OLL74277.1 Cytochrome c-type biogenesis protein CcsA/ResC [Pseudonocardia sp. Ae150A_Ps1]OLL80258.1 Cytochrome c-type biogenesis protein CcsA/ResC [Pseudonocardia sp. Ae168_Ps1]OLL85615.1 Cytochrome c-type biogenesis protein CcsA/ResC [Pseudonocardia sp. Ae263_Ps1]OLL94357.1 Cytochrome c-type biogenesis protein CcsA/ResC [Pseudonocardia sp. Ae356_Ps1]